MPFKASAPGSLMLLGEYAVLYGKPALVCAVDKRITVTLTPRADDNIDIHSAMHGDYTTTLADLSVEPPFQFVLGALKHYQAKMRRGCRLEIVSDFSDQLGLGSSSAVTVATLAALVTWLNIRISPLELVRQGRTVVRNIQSLGSGADVAASVYGGIVAYQAQPLFAEKFSVTHPLTVWYSGFKTQTAQAVKQVQAYFAAYPHLFRTIQNNIGQCATEATQLVRKGDWKRLGEMMNIQQGAMESLGVSTPLLRNMVASLQAEPGLLGAKISGAGLGDCVIGLGEGQAVPAFVAQGSEETNAIRRIPVEMTLQGVQCEKI